MPTTTSPLTPATHGLRVAASFNLRSGEFMEQMNSEGNEEQKIVSVFFTTS
jgi:hypothetical protein